MSKTFEALWNAAHAAGDAAAVAAYPMPMVVGSPSTPFGNDIDRSKPTYFISEGACGFAWIKIPGTSAFGRWAKKAGKARKGYGPGLVIWVSAYGQSVDRKAAYAGAFATVLKAAGIAATADYRLD